MSSKTATNYKRVDREAPPEGVVVETVTDTGFVSQLKRQGSLWFIPDGSMYVYYTPTLWREVTDE